MKILTTLPQVSIKASPVRITQDLGQFSVITIERTGSNCSDKIPITLIFEGSAILGEDFVIYYKQGQEFYPLAYSTLNSGKKALDTFIFSSNAILSLYAFPLVYNTLNKKEIRVSVLNDLKLFFRKIPSAVVFLDRSEQINIYSNTIDGDSQIEVGTLLDSMASIDNFADSFIQSDTNTHPVLVSTETPVVQFAGQTLNVITISRSGLDLTQNSIATLQSYSGSTYVLDADKLVIFRSGEDEVEIEVEVFDGELTLVLVSEINCVIGANNEIVVVP